MSGKHDPAEFNIEAIKQFVDQGNSVSSVAALLDIITRSRYALIKKYEPDSSIHQEQSDVQAELHRFQKELKGVPVVTCFTLINTPRCQ